MGVYDISRESDISLLDAMTKRQLQGQPAPSYIPGNSEWSRDPLLITKEGVVTYAIAANDDGNNFSVLNFVDTKILDLVDSVPAPNATAVHRDTALELQFSRPVPLTEANLGQYIRLVKETGSQQKVEVPLIFTVSEDSRTVTLQTGAALDGNTRYQIELTGELGSRRTRGLFDYTLNFRTGLATGAAVAINDIMPRQVETTGGEVSVTLANASGIPTFLVAGQPGVVQGSESLSDGSIRYTLLAPANTIPGPADLRVINGNSSEDELIGALQYVEPLVLKSLSPAQGSLTGGTRVTLKGQGFRFDNGGLGIFFGDYPVPAENITVMDQETLEVIAPAGRIGLVDVRVQLSNGQKSVLENAYRYLQPVQMNIENKARVHDMALDPSGSFVFAATDGGLVIYDIVASNYTGDESGPLNPDDLLRLIDRDDKQGDDRILNQVALPGGYVAMGVEPFFERGLIEYLSQVLTFRVASRVTVNCLLSVSILWISVTQRLSIVYRYLVLVPGG